MSPWARTWVGPISKAVFRGGLTVAIAPAGASQLPALNQVIDDLRNARVEGIDAIRDAEMPKLEAQRDKLETAVTAYQSARDAYNNAFAVEKGMRDEHRLAVDSLMGAVRGAYPGDKRRQNIIFPDNVVARGLSNRAADDDEDDDDGSEASLRTSVLTGSGQIGTRLRDCDRGLQIVAGRRQRPASEPLFSSFGWNGPASPRVRPPRLRVVGPDSSRSDILRTGFGGKLWRTGRSAGLTEARGSGVSHPHHSCDGSS